jgi:hypothetical protein
MSRDELRRTVEELADLGEKRAGTPGGEAAADYLRARLSSLCDVEIESFHFPRHEVARADLDGVSFEVLEASGSGELAAEVVDAGWANEERLAELNLRGKIALVDGHPLYHRSAQYANVAAAGARAFIYRSIAPHNLPQVGSVRRAWEAMGPIPAITVGRDDGARIAQARFARVAVDAAVVRGRGHNVVARVPGWDERQIVIGAHYDTWFSGSTDNGSGVAAMLALAQRRAGRMRPRFTLVFVAWDGEELALYGGYDFLRRHGRESILTVIDLETPSARGAQLYGLARSNHQPLDRAIRSVGLDDLFAMYFPMDLVPEMFGGGIPTDLQGLYRAGTPCVSTAVDAPFYHTMADLPDQVDLTRLVDTVDGFDRLLDRLLAERPERFAAHDPALWRLEARARDRRVEVRVRGADGRPRAGALVIATVMAENFFAVQHERLRTDEDGRAEIAIAAPLAPPAVVHIAVGARHPLAEAMVPLDQSF